jgi:hypothetical protein
MRTHRLLPVVVVFLAALPPCLALARVDKKDEGLMKGFDGPRRTLVLTGENVHNVGELQMHVGNWGGFGSYPGTTFPFAEQPSAQWPAGSGVEYLFASGIWIGALKSGVPAVTTSTFLFGGAEFRPDQADPRDIVYRSAEGIRGGNRAPSPVADDDNDGFVDEDWLNGFDDDNDGRIDEDFAAVSKQMFVSQYFDYGTTSTQIYPEHNPLNLHVRQESYQWEEDRYDDFIGAVFYITNRGNDVLEDMYIGFFADGDAGNRNTDNYFADDGAALMRKPAVCTDLGPVSLDVAFCYDVDGDEGGTPGYFGIMFLDHPVDPTGVMGPQSVGISTYANFSGSVPYAEGGDPANDLERYDLMMSQTFDRPGSNPRDYRMLMVGGPFREIPPDCTIKVQTCFVIGEREAGLTRNASSAVLTFEGAWFDLIGNDPIPSGYSGRETLIRGPASVQIDSCLNPTQAPIDVGRGSSIYINNDCNQERTFRTACGYSDEDSVRFMTGVGGAESQIFWIVGTAPPPPNMRIDDTAKSGVVLYWDNFSETLPDVKSLEFDFEGYRVFRADNWTRPIGTNAANGPPAALWKQLFQADIVDGLGDDTGLGQFRYEPLTKILPASKKHDMIETMKQYMSEHDNSRPPCPPGVPPEVCDTLFAMAAFEMGDLANGRAYYRYIDRAVHRGRPYFYAVTAGDFALDRDGNIAAGKVGDPASNFVYIEPGTPSQKDYEYNEEEVYVVPNPATAESMQPWTLAPNNDDPTGIKVEFRNLPADRGVIRVYTLAGDLVEELPFDGRAGAGTMKWDLVSRNGQDVTSGVYLYSIETDTNAAFKRKIGKFVVIR